MKRETNQPPASYWANPPESVLTAVRAGPSGLTSVEAAARLAQLGPNTAGRRRRRSRLAVLLGQLRNPLLVLLTVAAGIAIVSGEKIDAIIVLAIVAVTVGAAVIRESRAESALALLWARVRTTTRVVRDGGPVAVPLEEVVPGDLLELAAGSIVPADALVLEATDCFVAQAALTGEPFPVEKRPGPVAADLPLALRSNCVYLGTNVRSGTARCLVVATGDATTYAGIAARLEATPPETEFDRGLRRFSYLLSWSMGALVAVVVAIHVAQGRPPAETLLFAVALAVGLSPELLPAILSINLARGAALLSRRGVLVRHLTAIENLGSMDVICTDKTGTLTEGVVELEGAWDLEGQASPAVLELAARNAALTTGVATPLDEALLHDSKPDLTGIRKLGEVPFDFERKRVSVLVEENGAPHLITKGAFGPVLAASTRRPDGAPLSADELAGLRARFESWSARGIRVVAVADATPGSDVRLGRDIEHDLTFRGFVTFLDRPKERVAEAIADLARLGVTVQVVSGDTALVTRYVATLVGLSAQQLLTGPEIAGLDDAALELRVSDTQLYAEVDPSQKERIVNALRRRGHVVGFLGDGVNDAPAMHASDTALSVQGAVDVAREAADFVLLERDLDVIRGGIEEGRRTFANTLKYLLTTMSANLGNMLSMAAASLFLPFLPLLASQILLNNFLSDVPAFGMADDSVDPEMVEAPRRWDVGFIGRFMLVFGLVSSAFDMITFAVLRLGFNAGPELFRTGWFIESLLTELVIALVVRTQRPFFRSRPGNLLLWSTVVLFAATLATPWIPGARLIGFVPVSPAVILVMVGITALYLAATEGAKALFYRRIAGGLKPVRQTST